MSSTRELLSLPSLPLAIVLSLNTHCIDGKAEAHMAALSGQLEQDVTYTEFFKVPDAVWYTLVL